MEIFFGHNLDVKLHCPRLHGVCKITQGLRNMHLRHLFKMPDGFGVLLYVCHEAP